MNILESRVEQSTVNTIATFTKVHIDIINC